MRFFSSSSPTFANEFTAFEKTPRGELAAVDEVVRGILAAVQSEGDDALFRFAEVFDKTSLDVSSIRVSAHEAKTAFETLEPTLRDALVLAEQRIRAHHHKQIPQDQRYVDPLGVTLGYQWRPLASVGLYVPGGTASYPSSVLMNALPAKVAGVERLVMVVPARHGHLNPAVLAAAHLAGVDEIYRIGGAHAVAALAYGTASIAPVAKIVGPGNAYVAAAKRMVFGPIGIDSVAGPSEVLIVADETARPDWIAADLLAQAEHDPTAQSILITTSMDLGQQVARSVENQLHDLPRAAIAQASWQDYGAIIVVPQLADAYPLINRLAPEHLELHVRDPEACLPHIRDAGAIFLGDMTPEAIGDYVGGSNHVLPTARAARYASGLNVLDFMKKTTLLGCSERHLATLGSAAVTLARAEGLEGHARSVLIRQTGIE